MDVASRVSNIDTEQALFALGGILSAGLTALVYMSGGDPVQRFLYLCFTAYLLGAAIPPIYERVPAYRRTGAVALGAIGAMGYFAGTASALPLLFVIAGVAAILGII